MAQAAPQKCSRAWQGLHQILSVMTSFSYVALRDLLNEDRLAIL